MKIDYQETTSDLLARIDMISARMFALTEAAMGEVRGGRVVRAEIAEGAGQFFIYHDKTVAFLKDAVLVNEVPLRYPSYRSQGVASEEDLGRQGAAAWWLLARLSGWPGPQPETAE